MKRTSLFALSILTSCAYEDESPRKPIVLLIQENHQREAVENTIKSEESQHKVMYAPDLAEKPKPAPIPQDVPELKDCPSSITTVDWSKVCSELLVDFDNELENTNSPEDVKQASQP
jgi:hypothetical protein